jgi:hypothetical protein
VLIEADLKAFKERDISPGGEIGVGSIFVAY